MKEKDMNINENVIEMDMSKKKSEKHECANCGEEAIYYNTDTEKWICESCKNMEDELDKLAAKMEKKLSKRAYSFDIKELIECLSKDEIYNIARNLGVAKISGLNKDKLAEKLIGEYKPLIEKRIGLFDEERYRLLMTYIDKKGVKLFDEVDEEEADKSAYFIQQGMLYPTVKDETSMFLMPKIVQKLIKDKNDIDYRRVLKANTELINIYRGMNKAYGILKVEDAVNMLEKTKCDAIMIGRGAQGNPWIFNRINHYMKIGEILPEPTLEEKITTAIRHMNLAVAEHGDYVAVREMRKHIGWYLKGLKNSAKYRDQINKITDYKEVIAMLEEYMQHSLTQIG